MQTQKILVFFCSLYTFSEAGVVQWLAHSTLSPGCGLSTGSIPGQAKKISAGACVLAPLLMKAPDTWWFILGKDDLLRFTHSTQVYKWVPA